MGRGQLHERDGDCGGSGYAAWVDAQVGEGLTNGLYKFTVTVMDDPPEITLLSVGDLSVAVTNAGEYVFLLEKGVEYEYGTIPFLTNVTYSAVDDIPNVQPRLLSVGGDDADCWTVDGGYENQEPTAAAPGRVAWWPLFYGSPDVSHIGPGDSPVTFEAVLSDYCSSGAVAYQWTASDGLAVASPNSQSTEVTVSQMPSWSEANLSVTATLGAKTLYSYTDRLTYGTNDTPQVHLSLNLPAAILLNSNAVSAAKIAVAAPDGKRAVQGKDCKSFKGGRMAMLKPGAFKIYAKLQGVLAVCEVSSVALKDANLARLASVAASGEENGGLAARFAADGDMKTRWGSRHKDGEWIVFDFGRERTVSSAAITWENARAESYKIEVTSDGAKWHEVVSVPDNDKNETLDTWRPVKARKLRITGVRRNTSYGISIFEVEIK